ncbi:DUF2865 domain-containing protein [Neorhizobium sp. DT-125]|uniref:DUF2865 domain-containing protein n=1 Tax=Neorhizobium sp. DT-125 TaxID=3396163 RepID=UPI003F1B7F81
MIRFWLAAVVVPLALLVGQTASHAESCAPSRSQGRLVKSANDTQTAQLARQLSAIRAMERKRECTEEMSRGGGLFNACRDLANQRKKIQFQIEEARRSVGGKEAAGRKTASAACGAAAKSVERKQPAPKKSGYGNAMLYCVRLSDGYLFPAPNSQFVNAAAADTTLRQCQYICEDQGIEVYIRQDPTLETEEMVSVRSGTSYRELRTAFRYRDGGNFRRCDWERYVDRIQEVQLARMMSEHLPQGMVPIPGQRPEPEQEEISEEATASIGGGDRPLTDRPVRVVGPPFLPEL